MSLVSWGIRKVWSPVMPSRVGKRTDPLRLGTFFQRLLKAGILREALIHDASRHWNFHWNLAGLIIEHGKRCFPQNGHHSWIANKGDQASKSGGFPLCSDKPKKCGRPPCFQKRVAMKNLHKKKPIQQLQTASLLSKINLGSGDEKRQLLVACEH